MKQLFLLFLLTLACGTEVVEPVQLIQNGGFEQFDLTSEDPIPYWGPVNCPFGSDGVTVTPQTAYSGNASLKLVNNRCGIKSSYTLPKKVTEYTLTMRSRIWYVRRGSPPIGCSGECVRASVYWIAGDGSQLGVDVHYIGPFDDIGTTQWKSEKFTGAVMLKATSVYVELEQMKPTSYGYYVDDVALTVR